MNNIYKVSYKYTLLCLSLFFISNTIFSQKLSVSLSNPTTVSSTQITWDINVQNVANDGVSAGTGVMTIAVGNFPTRTTAGLIAPAVSSPLSIVIDPAFSALSVVPQMTTASSRTVFRFNGSGVPMTNPVVPNSSPALLGTVTFNSASAMSFPLSIGTTAEVPNVSVSGTYNAVILTLPLALPNSAPTNPIVFAAPLPIKISSLDAYKTGSTNTVKWATASEINNEYQIVETSLDGVSDWREVGRVKSKNASSGAAYQVVDNRPAKLNYYRIKSIDFDQSVQYSHVVTVRRDEKGLSKLNLIYPVPTRDLVNIDLDLVNTQNVQVMVLDLAGKVVMNREFSGSAGNNLFTLDLSTLISGSYLVSLTGNDLDTVQQQIIKQ